MLSLMNVKTQHDIFWEDSSQTQEQAIHLICHPQIFYKILLINYKKSMSRIKHDVFM